MDYLRAIGDWDFFKVPTESQLADWREFYQTLFGLKFGDLPLPGRDAQHLLTVAAGVSFRKAFEVCGKLFPCHTTQPVEYVESAQNLRSSRNGSYALWVGDVGPERQKWNPQTPDAVLGTTLTEELLHRMMYYAKTGRQIADNIDCLATRTVGDKPGITGRSGIFTVGWESTSLVIRWRRLSKGAEYSYRPAFLWRGISGV